MTFKRTLLIADILCLSGYVYFVSALVYIAVCGWQEEKRNENRDSKVG